VITGTTPDGSASVTEIGLLSAEPEETLGLTADVTGEPVAGAAET
jgi:hypothetical protein